ncbi:MAG TPA: hypothetical protein VK013_02535 [Myxococcaceae bacterium]|nr:hypothetical protein [Myxococcaceae bacterium]
MSTTPKNPAPRTVAPASAPEVGALKEALDAARGQLHALREKVRRHEALSQASAHATRLSKERDDALRALGEGLMRAVADGKLRIPPPLERLAAAVTEAEARREAHARKIDDLLAEGELAAARLREKNAPRPQTGLASRPKKR